MHHCTSTVAIQRNPRSGSGLRHAEIQNLTQGLENLQLSPFIFDDREQFAEQLQSDEFRKQLKCIVAAGGDGTIDDVINRYPGIPIAILPMGNENLLAKHFNIPQNGFEVAKIIASGETRKMDLGLAGSRRFAVMASCGFDAEIIERVHKKRTGHISKLNYLSPIFTTLWKNQQEELYVFTNESSQPYQCEMAIIANVPRYALNLSICPEAIEDDGLFDVCLIQSAKNVHLANFFVQAIRGSKTESGNVIRFQTDFLRIESDSPIPAQADGDPVGKTPLEFRIIRDALEIIVPETKVK